ncbi:MAG: hypothetical protein J6C07_03205 [Lachnospiraceae bacterium]|nr:hypothetical protein [Lachnospiraceae bacterium]
MKRGKKLVINLTLIFVILLGFYYFGGYYISKQQCIVETLQGLYGTESRKIMELQQGNYIITLMADENDESFSIVGIKKTGFLYRTASSSVGVQIDKERAMKVSGTFSSDRGGVVFIYRNHPDIVRVEVEMQDGEQHTITEWQENYAGFLVNDKKEWYPGTYKAYNAAGELIEEVNY